MTFRSLPTEYAGITFRSRLEARWARFFDGIDLRWEYEPEGVPLESGGYFPDFRVAPDGVNPFMLEVKGDPKELTAGYVAKLHEACCVTGMLLTIFGHMPDWRWYAGRQPAFPLIGPTPVMQPIHISIDLMLICTRDWPEGRPFTQSVEYPHSEPLDPLTKTALDLARNERFGLFPQRRR